MSLAERLHERAMQAESVEEARLECEERRDQVEDRRLAAEDHRQQLSARKRYVGHVGSRLIWTKAERDEVGALLVDLKRWLDEEAFFEEEFLQTPRRAPARESGAYRRRRRGGRLRFFSLCGRRQPSQGRSDGGALRPLRRRPAFQPAKRLAQRAPSPDPTP